MPSVSFVARVTIPGATRERSEADSYTGGLEGRLHVDNDEVTLQAVIQGHVVPLTYEILDFGDNNPEDENSDHDSEDGDDNDDNDDNDDGSDNDNDNNDSTNRHGSGTNDADNDDHDDNDDNASNYSAPSWYAPPSVSSLGSNTNMTHSNLEHDNIDDSSNTMEHGNDVNDVLDANAAMVTTLQVLLPSLEASVAELLHNQQVMREELGLLWNELNDHRRCTKPVTDAYQRRQHELLMRRAERGFDQYVASRHHVQAPTPAAAAAAAALSPDRRGVGSLDGVGGGVVHDHGNGFVEVQGYGRRHGHIQGHGYAQVQGHGQGDGYSHDQVPGQGHDQRGHGSVMVQEGATVKLEPGTEPDGQAPQFQSQLHEYQEQQQQFLSPSTLASESAPAPAAESVPASVPASFSESPSAEPSTSPSASPLIPRKRPYSEC